MPLAIAVGIAGIATAGAGLIASHNATSAASNAAAQNNALEQQIYNTNKGLETPFIQGGDAANTELQGFLGLSGDPAATQKAFQTYLDSTGYQFNRDQGLNAVTSSKAVGGLLNSGSTLKELDAYGTGLADQYGQQYVGNLQNEVTTGAGAANALAGQGNTYAQQVSNNNNSAASVSANAGLSAANAFGNVLGQGLSAYGLSKGGSSFGGASNAFSGYGPGQGAVVNGIFVPGGA